MPSKSVPTGATVFGRGIDSEIGGVLGESDAITTAASFGGRISM